MLTTGFLFDGPPPSRTAPTVVLAHGAGAPMDSPFMATVARGLAAAGLRVARFEFPYMQQRRKDGVRRPPDRPPVLLDCWRGAIGALGGGDRLVIGGKSLGGRIASMIADAVGARGLICLGYPFHAPGKPAAPERLAHMAALATPALIVQGARDALGNRDEVTGYDLSPAIRIAWIEDGDHSLKPRVAAGRTEADNLQAAIDAAAVFVTGL